MDYNHTTASGSASGSGRSTLATNYRNRYASNNNNNTNNDSPPQQHQYYTQHHPNHIEALKSRLSPIRHIEQMLISKLVPPNEEEATHLGHGNIGGNGIHYMNIGAYSAASSERGRNGGEVFVRPTSMWKGALARARVSYPSFLGDGSASASGNSSGSDSGSLSTEVEGPDEAQETLNALCGDMIQLWQDAGIREVLRRRKIRLEEASGFFLNDLQRVTSLKYMPSDGESFLFYCDTSIDICLCMLDDVLKARLKTVGVAEYRFEMEVPMSRDTGTEWRIVDVGGSRSQVSISLSYPRRY